MTLCCDAGHIAQRFLARHHTVLQIGSTVFVHGGILPSHADYGLERINRSVYACYVLYIVTARCLSRLIALCVCLLNKQKTIGTQPTYHIPSDTRTLSCACICYSLAGGNSGRMCIRSFQCSFSFHSLLHLRMLRLLQLQLVLFKVLQSARK